MQGLVLDDAADPVPTIFSRLPLGRMPESFIDGKLKSGVEERIEMNGIKKGTSGVSVNSDLPVKFGFLQGDAVLMGGYYGSHLKDQGGELEWLSIDIILGLKKCCLSEEKKLLASGVIDKIGPFDVCSLLIRELSSFAEKSSGGFRLHQYGYDWRLSGQVMALNMVQYLEKIYLENGNQSVVIIAHSMGGLIALSAAQKRPELVKGIVFCGTPFGLGGVPLVLWGLHRGAPLSRNFSPELHFGCPSSFLFLPRDGKALVDSKNEDILIDFFNPEEWLENRISNILPSNTNKLQYLKDSLKDAKEFCDSLARSPLTDHVFVVVTSGAWPTPTRLKAHFKTHISKNRYNETHDNNSELKISSPSHFEAGDGIVSKETAMMPLGYDFHVLYTKFSHLGMMNDLETIEKGLAFIYGSKNET